MPYSVEGPFFNIVMIFNANVYKRHIIEPDIMIDANKKPGALLHPALFMI